METPLCGLPGMEKAAAEACCRCRCLPAGVSYSILPGTHVTPCGGDVAWETGRVFAPADALALAAKAVLQADLRRAARQITDWYGGVVASEARARNTTS